MKDIVVYTKNNCVYCRKTENMLKQYGVGFKEQNIETVLSEDSFATFEKLVEENDVMTMPVVATADGEFLFSGFKPLELVKIKNQKKIDF